MHESTRLKALALVALSVPLAAIPETPAPQPVELHHVLVLSAQAAAPTVALTLDACGGRVDSRILAFLIDHNIPATVFATRRWIRRNPEAMATLRAHPDLFDVENHGANHVPAVIGADRLVYGLAGAADLAAVKREVAAGAAAVQAATGNAPHWYRGATGLYDPEAVAAIESMGYGIAGFSINVDRGASLTASAVAARLGKARNGDILIAHLNQPDSGTGEGLATGLQALLARGFRFVALRGQQLKSADRH
jgi:peptidoglycan/xylan/chitin deacetylase (PgdA/CDA1 family)